MYNISNTKRIHDFALRTILPTTQNREKKVSRYDSVQNFRLPPTHPKLCARDFHIDQKPNYTADSNYIILYFIVVITRAVKVYTSM